MKKLLLICLLPVLIYPQTQYRFFINNINMPMDNRGVLGLVDIPPDGRTGRFDGVTFLFDGGFWLSGYNSDTLWANAMATAAQFENYIPGNVDSNQYDPRYDIYVVENSDNINYDEWNRYKFAVINGADFYDGDGNGIYDPIDLNGNNSWDPNEDKPDVLGLGSQTAWCVYNDGVPADQRERFPTVDPLGIEMHQSVFAYGLFEAPQLQNVIFIRYKIINTGKVESKLDSVYFSAWTDTDLGYSDDDLVGSDTLLQSGYVYNNLETDPGFGSEIPSHFVTLLQGPQSYIPGETFIDINSNGIYDDGIDTPLDTAYNYKGKDLGIELYPGAKNSSMTSFIHFVKSTLLLRTPNNPLEARYYMNGLTPDGLIATPCDSPFDWLGEVRGGINCTEVNPLYWYSGYPVTDIGWQNIFAADQRMIVNTGPFNLEVGKPVSIIVAYIVGRGTDRLNSITKAREIAQFTHQFYKSNFDDNLVSVEESNPVLTDYKLHQNYPNPFNPSTKIKYTIPNVTLSPDKNGINSVEGSRVQLRVYDVLGNEIATLVNQEKLAGTYEVEFSASKFASGVYFYQLKAGNYFETKKMILIK